MPSESRSKTEAEEPHVELKEQEKSKPVSMGSSVDLGSLANVRAQVEQELHSNKGIEWLDHLDETLFFEHWQEYLNEVEKRSSFLFNSIAIGHLELENNIVKLQLPSTLSFQNFQAELGKLLPVLRDKCRYRELQFELSVQETELKEAKPYSDKEIYDHFVKKNPALEEMRKRLNLDIEF